MNKPNCYQCKHRRNLPGDTHSMCGNVHANVTGSPHGIQKGWFFWPLNFDPLWLASCDGFEITGTPDALPHLPREIKGRTMLTNDEMTVMTEEELEAYMDSIMPLYEDREELKASCGFLHYVAISNTLAKVHSHLLRLANERHAKEKGERT